ncbi:AIR synthase-related protein [Blastocystis sp. ATCC 50177/Nand II]|uniref:AIR synthase-related protein n=1 Tax=Blastocystis sp. subtype 1 (strain ATCC 50177 / NandII) TaxID=478820 RepID=A0A196SE46_BLAHN|nr:AIR synthase-related protein [Blastocystis sp. ATCC 50177/Nand II]
MFITTGSLFISGFIKENDQIGNFDIISSKVVLVGGFSYADVLESVSNRTATILFNTELKAQFEAFYARPDTFSLALLGICNGCQLMAQLNFVPWKGIEEAKQPRFIQNKSGRFESRFVNVHVEKSNAITLQGMEGSTLGVWVAHGEGLCLFTTTVKEKAMLQNCVALKNANNGNTVPMRCCDGLLILKGVDRHEKVNEASLNRCV